MYVNDWELYKWVYGHNCVNEWMFIIVQMNVTSWLCEWMYGHECINENCINECMVMIV